MLRSRCEIVRHVTPVCVMALWLLGPLAVFAWPQEAQRLEESRPALRCGKLRTLAAKGFLPGWGERSDSAYPEPLSDTDVLHNVLDIEVSNLDPTNNTCTLIGSNVMTVQSKSPSLEEFTFRLRTHYNISGSYVNSSIPVTVTTPPSPNTTTRIVTLNRAYGVDEVFTLTIEYTGNTVYIPSSPGSIKVGTQPDDTPVVATISQPYYSYSWWPVKEGDVSTAGDNSDKFTMEFSITVPDNMTVPSNGLLQGVDTLSGDRRRYRWASDYPIVPSLVSFAATEYNTWTQTYQYSGGTMPVEFYIYPPSDNETNRARWEECIVMLSTYARLFGEYPFVDEKYGIYQFPFAGLEHQTMTGQGDAGGYDPFDEFLTAHELAHQWWGDMITCKTWNHVWLNEGFASYADALWGEFKELGPAMK